MFRCTQIAHRSFSISETECHKHAAEITIFSEPLKWRQTAYLLTKWCDRWCRKDRRTAFRFLSVATTNSSSNADGFNNQYQNTSFPNANQAAFLLHKSDNGPEAIPGFWRDSQTTSQRTTNAHTEFIYCPAKMQHHPSRTPHFCCLPGDHHNAIKTD